MTTPQILNSVADAVVVLGAVWGFMWSILVLRRLRRKPAPVVPLPKGERRTPISRRRLSVDEIVELDEGRFRVIEAGYDVYDHGCLPTYQIILKDTSYAMD
jgi:hypothetical protein